MALEADKLIFLTGGSGRLGTELKVLKPEIIAPTSEECNILSLEDLERNIDNIRPAIFVHAAAYTDVVGAEHDPSDCIEINVTGTNNILKICRERGIKLVYISTDYVFDGEKGNYRTTDPINPLTNYAKTKAAGELIVRTYSNHLIIRTSFFGYDFPYEKAPTDQWSTKDYVDIIAPKVLYAINHGNTGILHVGSQKRSTYEIARERKPDVQKIKIQDLNTPIPRDISLR